VDYGHLKKIDPVITREDKLFMFTIGGVGGLITFIIGLYFLPEKWAVKRHQTPYQKLKNNAKYKYSK